jgi:hypothetical protein
MPDPIVVNSNDPRPLVCQVPDHQGNFTPRWAKRELTWAIQTPIPDLRGKQEALTELALSTWSAVCGMRFRRVDPSESPDVPISTARGTRNGFDGPGGVLAYAYLPGSSHWSAPSPMWFDLEERWSGSPAESIERGAIRYVAVCAHEFGHTLGLSHGSTGALMQPLYAPNLDRPQREDIRRIQSLYGPPLPTSADSTPATGAERLAEIRRLAAEIVRLTNPT